MAQIREFESTTESYFILDGVSYPKVYEAMLDNGYSDTKIKLVGTNRDTTPLVFSTEYTNIRVDGDSFDTALEAISRLNQIVFSKGGGSGGGGTSNQNSINRIPSATYSELGITPESTIEEKQTAIATFLEGYDNAETDNLFFEIKEDVIEYNFDVTANWDLAVSYEDDNPMPITDKPTFLAWLETMFAEVSVTNFSLEDGKLKAFIIIGDRDNSGGFEEIQFLNMEVTSVISLNIENLRQVVLGGNLLTEFNPLLNISLRALYTRDPISNIDGLIIPNGLEVLDFRNLQITQFPASFSLPNTLITFYITNSELEQINITDIGTNLRTISFNNNKISDWSLSEGFANSVPETTESFVVNTGNNPTSSNGTNFQTILESKGWTVNS